MRFASFLAIAALTCALAASSVLAQAQEHRPTMTAQKLKDLAEAGEPTRNAAALYVWGFVEADSSLALAWRYQQGQPGVPPSLPPPLACPPAGVTPVQALEVAVAEIKKRPDIWHAPASLAVRGALYRTWPCSRN